MEKLTVQQEERYKSDGLFNGKGSELRVYLRHQDYVISSGITNRTIESFANKVKVESYGDEFKGITTDFTLKLGEVLVGIGYAIRSEPIKGKQVDMGIKTKQMEDGLSGTGSKNGRLSARGRWIDGVDFSILLLRSAQWAFILVIIGVLGQAFHIYHVVENLSDLYGWAKIANGLLWAIFLSFGLVYFSLKLGRVTMAEPSKVKKYKLTVAWFVVFDVFANLYYWAYRFVLLPGVLDNYMKEFTENGITYRDVDWPAVDWMTFELSKVQWPQMIAATVFAFAIPFILKAFAGEIDLPARLDDVFRSYNRETLNQE